MWHACPVAWIPELFSAPVLARVEQMAPQAGVAAYVRGPRGELAAARVYDDVDAPVSR